MGVVTQVSRNCEQSAKVVVISIYWDTYCFMGRRCTTLLRCFILIRQMGARRCNVTTSFTASCTFGLFAHGPDRISCVFYTRGFCHPFLHLRSDPATSPRRS